MPIYRCPNCTFTFKRQKQPATCPYCQKESVRPVTPAEEEQFLIENRNQTGKEKKTPKK